jgi:hypothetical protein
MEELVDGLGEQNAKSNSALNKQSDEGKAAGHRKPMPRRYFPHY